MESVSAWAVSSNAGQTSSVVRAIAELGQRRADSSEANANWDFTTTNVNSSDHDSNDTPKVRAEQASELRSQRMVSGQDLGSIRIHQLSSQEVAALDPSKIADTVALSIRDLTSEAMQSSDRFAAEPNIDVARAGQITDMTKVYEGFDAAVNNAVVGELSILDQIGQITSIATQETDPHKLAQLLRKVEQLRTQLNEVLKEKDKAEAVRALVHQLMFGSCDPALIQKLRSMGLGDLAERLVCKFLKTIKKMHGGQLPIGLVVSLAVAGLGHLVQVELAQLRNALEEARRIRTRQPQTITAFAALHDAWLQGSDVWPGGRGLAVGAGSVGSMGTPMPTKFSIEPVRQAMAGGMSSAGAAVIT